MIPATAAIMAAAIGLMCFVLQMNTQAHRQTRAVVTIGRLAEQFRHDVHQARGEAVVAAAHRAAELRLPDGRIVKWRIDGAGRVVRTEGGAGIPPADREDSFTLPGGATAALELRRQGAARIVTLRIQSPDADGPSLAIEALATRDEPLAVEERKP